MPFDLTNAPGTFRRLMDKVFQGLLWKIVVVYLDDITVFSPTFEKHLDDLEIVIERLKQAGLA